MGDPRSASDRGIYCRAARSEITRFDRGCSISLRKEPIWIWLWRGPAHRLYSIPGTSTMDSRRSRGNVPLRSAG